MMKKEEHQKITSSHLKRNVYLYIRQSTMKQVFENTESTQRQYALRNRAVALGWRFDQVIVIDDDLGRSGATVFNRQGFQRLVTEVGIGKAGLVMGLEVSRLARNSADWHRLLEICALTETLLLDEDGLYDPKHFNDRLVLGLKGTMSEAELHLLRSRLQGGVLSKARRGELRSPIPVGFIYDAKSEVILDPDRQVQEAIHLFFRTFRRTGSAHATVKSFRQQGILFPRRIRKGPRKGDLVWGEFYHFRALQILHNPRYAGAFFYGRTHTRKKVDGSSVTECVPKDEWHALFPGSHKGYISWEDYEENQRLLREQAQAHGRDRRKSPPREGPALLQGLVMCGICGLRMTVAYETISGGECTPVYRCQKEGIKRGQPPCQVIGGSKIDEAVGTTLLESFTPATLDIALQVQHELQSRHEETDRLRKRQVERAQYEVDLSRRRYMQVDPDNRLVADTLEADWNDKLRAVAEAQDLYEKQSQADRIKVDDRQREQIMALAKDFPRLWNDPRIPPRERKRMIRLLIEDVTLTRNKEITVHIRFKGGQTKTILLSLPESAVTLFKTKPEVVETINQLLNENTYQQIAEILNQRGLIPGRGTVFNSNMITNLRNAYGLKSRYNRLRERGLLTRKEIADRLAIPPCTVRTLRKNGILKAHAYSNHKYLYESPQEKIPITKSIKEKNNMP
jgi:DNA invertase Pin-like site-specific DNA recombinase